MTATTWTNASTSRLADSSPQPLWANVSTWFALFITLFITVGGGIKLNYAPIALALTAMAGNSIKQIAIRLCCLFLMLLMVSTRSRVIWNACLNARFFLVLPILAFASVLWSQSPALTLLEAATLALTTLFAVYLYVRFPGDQLISFLTGAAAVALLACTFVVVFFPNIGVDALQEDSWRGVFSQRNNCAVYCVCFLVIGLHYRARHLAQYFLRATVLLLALLFIVMSGSRTGWLVTVFAVGVTFGLRLIQRMPWRVRLLFLMTLTIPAGAVILLVAAHLNELLGLIGKDPTLSQRTIIWLTVLSPIAKHPFVGYGYSAFWLGLAGESANTVLITGWAENQAQSGYLDVMLQLGLLGLIPLVWMLGRGLIQASRALNPRNTAATQAATVLLLVLIVENVGESGFVAPLNILWFYTLLALLILDRSRKPAEVL
jgi:O-antigen ligase